MAAKHPSTRELEALWSRHHAEWRDSAQIASQWKQASETHPRLLQFVVQGAWWEVLVTFGLTLLVSREYEHLLMAIYVENEQPVISYMPMPHPSGLVADRKRGVVHIASTRNPNQIYDLMPVVKLMPRLDIKVEELSKQPLVPVRSRFLPGCLYLHDLALIDGVLYANAVGQNAIIRLDGENGYQRVWWPRCIETAAGPVFEQNHLQLNSIAAGTDLAHSYFSSSTDKISARRPGHKNFPVDKRGVIFSGATREPIGSGLTRPHSARLHNERIWVDNSGYGELGFMEQGKFEPVARLPGWTRGLCFHKQIAFVGTSRVIPRFSQYAPGLKIEDSVCGVHVVDSESGQVLGSLIWPHGNQIFAMDWVPSQLTSGFPFIVGAKRATEQEKLLFYAYETSI